MAEAIAELRGELATNGTYSADPVVPSQATQKTATPAQGAGMGMGMQFRQDFVYGLGSALPKEPTKDAARAAPAAGTPGRPQANDQAAPRQKSTRHALRSTNWLTNFSSSKRVCRSRFGPWAVE